MIGIIFWTGRERQGVDMDDLIQRISEIEAAANGIMENLTEQKAAFSAEIKKRGTDFEAMVDADTEQKIKAVSVRMEQELKEILDRQQRESQETMQRLDETYEKGRKALIDELFTRMIKE